MKKILSLLLIVVSFWLQSQTNPGTIYFKDGSSKKGIISSPKEIAKGKVLFKKKTGLRMRLGFQKLKS